MKISIIETWGNFTHSKKIGEINCETIADLDKYMTKLGFSEKYDGARIYYTGCIMIEW
jgi:hypothetical protein